MIRVKDLQFEYEEFGKRDDPAIIMIMGLGEQLIFWSDELCKGLADEGFRVIRFDNRDAGLSTKLSGQKVPSIARLLFLKKWFWYSAKTPYTISDMADDVVGIMDALGIAKAHIVGSSMGGLIAQVLGIEHPDRILTITTIFATTSNLKIKRPDDEILALMDKRPARDATEEERIAYKLKVFSLLAGSTYPMDAKIEEKVIRSVKRCYYPEGTLRQLAALVREPATSSRLKNMKLPLLVIHGAEDRLVPVEHGLDIAKNAPNSRLVIIEKMGHLIPTALIGKFITLISEHAKSIKV